MNPTHRLRDLGQSLWLDYISRDLLTSGTLHKYIRDLAVTGLTSNPTIFDKAISSSSAYDADMIANAQQGAKAEEIFFHLALADLTKAADLFLPLHHQTNGVDGWVSLEVSPLLAHDALRTLEAAKDLHARAKRANLFIKIPGTPAGLPAVEEAIFAGVPVNVTLLFSKDQYLAAAEAYLRGIERRIAAGLPPHVCSVASVFISRWDGAIAKSAPADLRNKLGIAVAKEIYQAYRELINDARWQRAFNYGASMQRLLWASTGTKDPEASDVLYIDGLVSPFTINTMPEATLKAFADHGQPEVLLPACGGDCRTQLARFAADGIDVAALAHKLQEDGTELFVQSWHALLACIEAKTQQLANAG